ncbi:MAG: hypothetical protein ABSD96_12700 [Candidatus Korobacteraceae bacterium]|jgi:antibiotic biosynthesis monooxygenase (ABM) superfamily enzyme
MYMMLIEGELKPGKKDEFLKAWSSQILPLLKKQDGFVDEIMLFEFEEGHSEYSMYPCFLPFDNHNHANGSQQPRGLCFWESREQCERYQREVFPQAKNFVEHLMHGKPKVRKFEVAAAEIFKITQRKVA